MSQAGGPQLTAAVPIILGLRPVLEAASVEHVDIFGSVAAPFAQEAFSEAIRVF